MIERKLFEKVDDNPGEYFSLLVEEYNGYTENDIDAVVARLETVYVDPDGYVSRDAYNKVSKYLDKNYPEIKEVVIDSLIDAYGKPDDESLKEEYDSTYASVMKQADSDAQKLRDSWEKDGKSLFDTLSELGYESDYEDSPYMFKDADDGNTIVFDFRPINSFEDYVTYFVVDKDNRIPDGWTKTKLMIDFWKDENESLNEADTIAKPFRKIAKRDYKNFDNRRDRVKNFNDEIEKRLASHSGIKKGSKDYETVKGFLTNNVPEYGKSRKVNSRGLEKNKYPFYVTYYIETPYYHPEEGGYYVAGRYASDSEGFDKKEDAIKVAEEVANDLEMRKISNTEYVKDSKYIGDKAYIFVETEKEYLGKEQGDEQYESLKESVEDTVSKILSKEVSQPRGFKWLSNNGISGEVEYNGTKYAFKKLDNGKYKVIPSSKAGWNWSETLFKDESLKEDKFVSRDKMSKKDRKELDSKKRNTWGNTNPVTRVQPNKKAYDRKRDKKELDEELTEDSEIFKDMSNALDDIEYLCKDTYNWETSDWNNKENIKRTAERIIESAQVLLDSIKKY